MEFSPTIFILQLCTFLLGLFLAAKIYIPYIQKWMSDRQKRIETQLATAEKRQKEAEELKAKFEMKFKSLEDRTQALIREAQAEAEKTRSELMAKAHKEAETTLDEAKRSIEQEKQQVLKSVREEVGTLAVSIAEKLMRSQIDPKVQEKIVSESLKEIKAKKN